MSRYALLVVFPGILPGLQGGIELRDLQAIRTGEALEEARGIVREMEEPNEDGMARLLEKAELLRLEQRIPIPLQDWRNEDEQEQASFDREKRRQMFLELKKEFEPDLPPGLSYNRKST